MSRRPDCPDKIDTFLTKKSSLEEWRVCIRAVGAALPPAWPPPPQTPPAAASQTPELQGFALHLPGLASWPSGVDFHLTAAACRLAALVEAGCEWQWCPVGGLDVTMPDGRLWALAPATVTRLRTAGLLPEALAATPPDDDS